MKKFIILLAGLLVLVLLFALLLPSKISIVKTTEINATKVEIISEINDFKNWPHWFPVLKGGLAAIEVLSPEKAVITRKDGGKMDLLMIARSPDSVRVQISARRSSVVEFNFIVQPESSGLIRLNLIANTTFQWYPWEKAKGLFIDKISGPQYEEALDNLRKQIEEKE